MSTIIDAVYEGGFFRPTQQVELKEGTHVEVHVLTGTAQRDPKAVAEKLRSLAEKSPSQHRPESTARNHDQFLYDGKPKL